MVDNDLEVLAAKRRALVERARLVFEQSRRVVEESRKIRAETGEKFSVEPTQKGSDGVAVQRESDIVESSPQYEHSAD
jgi:hypothetical protein